jgi:hypothetical protein
LNIILNRPGKSNGLSIGMYVNITNAINNAQKNEKVKTSIGKFFKELFNVKKSFTKSDIDMVSAIYKVLDKNLKK